VYRDQGLVGSRGRHTINSVMIELPLKVRRVCVSCVLAFGMVAVVGCSNSAVYNGAAYSFDASQTDRERVIEVVRDVLSEYRFVIDRVDARRGVVTTEFKSTQGIVSPWDGEQGSLREESADFVNQHERSVRVEIDDAGEVIVMVVVQRIHQLGRRIETEAISRSSRATIIGTDGNREPARQVTPIGIDGQLAQRIGERIDQRLSTIAGQ